jgi:hypothetical protein
MLGATTAMVILLWKDLALWWSRVFPLGSIAKGVCYDAVRFGASKESDGATA